jgi:hypothetical protein
MDASPGVPWMKLAPNNRVIMREFGGVVWACVMQRLKALCTCNCSEMTAEELVKAGLCDPIRVFVKNEPHSTKKLEEGRVRLIMSVSLADQLVERVLSSEQNQLEIASFHRLPVKPGMGFSNEKIDLVGAHFDKFEELVSSDVSGWDWSVSAAELRFDAERRVGAAGVPMDHPYARALLARSTCLSRSVIAFSDGEMVAQRWDGVQKSGSYNTSSGNSWIRVAAARFAGAGEVVAMGDDCVDDGADAEVMAVLGHPLKDQIVVDGQNPSWCEDVNYWPSELRDDVRRVLARYAWEPYDTSMVPRVDFCSHWWCKLPGEERWILAYRGWRKSLFRLACVRKDKEQHLGEFIGLMAHSPVTPHCVRMLLDSGWCDDFQLL